MYTLVAKDWRELSKAASEEHDPKKFMELIEQLNEALEQHYGEDDKEASHRNYPETQFDAA
jgi:hypothetical protein